MKFSKRVAHISPSPTLGITAKAKRLLAQGLDVISFGAGEPDFDTPSYVKEEAKRAIDAGFTKYTPTSGIPQLKDAICEKLKKDNGLTYEPPQIVVSCGAKHSLFNAILALCEEGDEVIIPSPYWVSYPEMVKIAGAKPVVAATEEKNGFKLTLLALVGALTKNTKLLILNSPSNPTGCVYSKAELEVIANLARERDFYVMSDEIYEKLIYDGAKAISIASLSDDSYKRTVVVNGVSKSHSMTGWRIGYLAGPKDLADAVSRIQDHSTSNPASISQMAALAALRADDSFVEGMLKEFKIRRDSMVSGLNEIPKLRAHNPAGAFYVFCDISNTGLSGNAFAEELLDKARVAVIPGEGFGWPTHIRLSFAIGMDKVKDGLARIAKFVMELPNG